MHTIRTATLRDIDDVVDLRLQLLYELNVLSEQSGTIRFRESTRGYFINKIQSNDFKAWVADIGDTIVSMTSIHFIEHPPVWESISAIDAHVMDVYTVKDMRGTGIASDLLRHVIEYARQNRAQRIVLNTLGKDKRIYEKLGFVSTINDMELSLA